MKLTALRYPLENPVVEAWEILYVAPSWMFMLIKYERTLQGIYKPKGKKKTLEIIIFKGHQTEEYGLFVFIGDCIY